MVSRQGRIPEPTENDNGNIDLPTVVHPITNGGSNSLINGTLYGDPNFLPNKFLSAKNSIEIHKNKVLSNNQSLPNVHHRIPGCELQSIFSHPRHKRTYDGAGPTQSHKPVVGQKSAKTVNWAPTAALLVEPKTEEMVSPQTSKLLLTVQPVSGPTGSESLLFNRSIDDTKFDDQKPPASLPKEFLPTDIETLEANEEKGAIRTKAVELINYFSTIPSLTCQFQSPKSKDIGKVASQTQSHTSLFVSDLPSATNSVCVPLESARPLTSLPYTPNNRGLNTRESDTRTPLQLNHRFSNTDLSYYQHMETCGTGVNFENLAYNNASDFMMQSENMENNKSSCIFLPSADITILPQNPVVNATAEIRRTHSTNTPPIPPTHQNQEQQVDLDDTKMTPILRLDNHNYNDNEDDVAEPDNTSVLTMVNPAELPVPDADYIARFVPAEMHHFISKKCKKDCRTWLWKSASKRQTALEEQRRADNSMSS